MTMIKRSFSATLFYILHYSYGVVMSETASRLCAQAMFIIQYSIIHDSPQKE